MSNRGCKTCSERKVRCDRALPCCRRCIILGRPCPGYGFRLSWPRRGDAKRAVSGPAPLGASNLGPKKRTGKMQIVNVSAWDVEMQPYFALPGEDLGAGLARVGTLRRDGRPAHARIMPFLARAPATLPHADLTAEEMNLFQYFISVASFSLPAFGQIGQEVRRIILRMALSHGSTSSTAVLRATIALAALHQHAPQSKAVRYKAAALRALSATMNTRIGLAQSFQHVAAGMLLCACELQQPSDVASYWLWYLCGSKRVIRATKLDEDCIESDFAALVGWVQYYGVLAIFSLRHWRRINEIEIPQIKGLGYSATQPTVCGDGQGQNLRSPSFDIIGLKGPSRDVLVLLGEVCDTALQTSSLEDQEPGYRDYLKLLEWKLTSLDIESPRKDENTEPSTADEQRTLQLYRLATLIYLVRSSSTSAQPPAKLLKWVNEAFAILGELDTCQSPFPLFILGCEANTDEQRVAVLNVISRTEEQTFLRNLESVTAIIKALWVQEDLLDGELDYAHKLRVVFSSSSMVPALV